MSKHPHLLLLINKKTWKCVLEGCNFFVHQGLAPILVGKSAVCWNCEGRFALNEDSLNMDKPICDECRLGVSDDIIEKFRTALGDKKNDNSNS